MNAARPVTLIVPALNEERSIGLVLQALPRDRLREIVVVDNGSTDRTAAVAAGCGARVVREPRRGYGRACLSGIAALDAGCTVVAFLDADFSDDPSELEKIIGPVERGETDLNLGSRELGRIEPGAHPAHARWGNRLATTLIRWRFGHRYTDLGPFRAIRRDALDRLQMRDPDYGWTVEMQIKAVLEGLRVTEVPVSYRRRVGVSKVSGTVRGTLGAGCKILGLIARYGILPKRLET